MSTLARLLAAAATLLTGAFDQPAATPSAAAPPQPRSGRLMLGLQDDALLTSAERNAWPLARGLHLQVIRYSVAWDQVARRRPRTATTWTDPAYDWSRVDLMATRTAALGAAPLFTLVGAPRWASGHAQPAWGPRRAADFGAFCSAIGSRYSGSYAPPGASAPLPRVDLYTIWNEVNRGQYFEPQGAGGRTAAQREAALVAACLPRLHAANPHARVALGPLASRGAQGGIGPLGFLHAYRRAGGPAPDALALNPYLEGLLPVYRPQERQPGGAITLRNLDQLEAKGRALFGRPLPVWLTEFAWRVGNVRGMGPVSTERQAALARQSVQLVRGRYPYAQLFVWFLLRDESPSGYWRTGLVRYDWRRNPVYRVWASGAPWLPEPLPYPLPPKTATR